ncbi:calcium-binding protein [Phenylobacterium sp. J367]|uniref:beta strand repeat-containing protein n=1 Tax=Phenylobacterium sp. J367 TaxID=2898435 RepID=UPI0021507C7B|nr:calcium-binding protein [Phenylobacterium sp. J367]MCR5879488.1 hypothetical protein [Phenylobacterium sp. J367]
MQVVQGQSGLIVQLVQGQTVTDVFNVTLGDDGAAVVTGVGPMAGMGSDTLAGVEHLHFYPEGSNQPFLSIDRTLNVSSTFVGGTAGNDVIDIASLSGVNLAGSVGANGGLGDDTITGHAGNNQALDGGGGADRISGQGGDDYLIGGAGSDTLDGGAGGNDIAAFRMTGQTTGTVQVVEGAGGDAGKLIVQLVEGQTTTDVFRVTIAGDGAATVEGLGPMGFLGTDTVSGMERLQFLLDLQPPGQGQSLTLSLVNTQTVLSGIRTTFGTAGADTLDLAQLYTDAGADEIIQAVGGLGRRHPRGHGPHRLSLRPARGGLLSGGAGDDFLQGGLGNDTLDGGANTAGDREEVGGDIAGYGDAVAAVTVDLGLQGVAQNTGGGGTDVLINIEQVYGSNFDDTLKGDGGRNFLYGASGADTLLGGQGDDGLEGGAGNDLLDGGDGIDIAAFTTATSGVTVDLAITGAQDVGGGLGSDTFVSVEELFGSEHGDTLRGDGAANYIDGQEGADSLVGRAGDDVLLGEDGDDTLDGGAGDDEIRGEDGADTAVFSGARADYLISANSDGSIIVTDQRANSPDGTDTLWQVEFLKFSDLTLTASDVGGALFGGSGPDTLQGGANADTISGLGGDDVLSGGSGGDRLVGGDGFDILRGQAGDDTLLGEDGPDLLAGGAGNDLLDGGAGLNRASFNSASAGVNVSLLLQGQAQAAEGSDTLINIRHLTGSNFNDTLVGDANANWLWGTGGSDSLVGGDGNDLLSVGNGAHTLVGGQGDDTVSFYSETLVAPVTVSLANTGAQNTGQGVMTLSGIENLSGTMIGADVLTGDGAANVLAGWGGSDTLNGGGGNDLLLGEGYVLLDGDAAITLFENGIEGTVPAGADVLIGGLGDDTLVGGAGADRLEGGDGADVARFSGARADYEFALQADGSIRVSDLRSGAPDGVDTLIAVEVLRFSDGDVPASTIGGNNTGTSGSDTLSGTAGGDTISGLGGSDVIFGGAGADLLKGGEGDDGLRGEAGDDTLRGEAGNDFLAGYGGDDRLEGGDGYDRAAFSSGATNGVRVDLNLQGQVQNTFAGNDVLVDIEAVSGTRYSDTLTGDAGDNWLWGGADGSGVTGNDVIDARDGNDLVQVGVGDHTLIGGQGIDTLSFHGNGGPEITTAGVAASLAAQGATQATRQGAMEISGFENLSGSAYGDILTGDDNANVLAGFEGSDSLIGGDGADLLLGDGVVIAASAAGTAGASYLDENAGRRSRHARRRLGRRHAQGRPGR